MALVMAAAETLGGVGDRLDRELLLAAWEVVVQRAAGGTTALEDLGDAGGVQALDSEELVGGPDHAGRGRPWSGRRVTPQIYLDYDDRST